MSMANHKTIAVAMLATALAATGCKAAKDADAADHKPQPAVVSTKPSAYVPKAVIYRTNGDYNQNVPVTLNASRTAIVSYPGPSDVSESSTPVALGDGWLLDRRGGVGLNTAFTRYTYSQYAKLTEVPSASDLMSSILPEARVTEVKTLPITLNEALADPSALKKAFESVTQ